MLQVLMISPMLTKTVMMDAFDVPHCERAVQAWITETDGEPADELIAGQYLHIGDYQKLSIHEPDLDNIDGTEYIFVLYQE